jgi:hypothetical protein
MDRTIGIVIVGALGLLLLSLTLVDQQHWATEWLPPEIAREVERVGAAMATQPEVSLPAKVQPGGPGKRSPGAEVTGRNRRGYSEE